MMKQENGVMINARMIGMQSRVVVATAQSFIPNWVIGDNEINNVSESDNVKMKDGLIIRDSTMLIDDDRAVEIQK
jgi:hypothetical protein